MKLVIGVQLFDCQRQSEYILAAVIKSDIEPRSVTFKCFFRTFECLKLAALNIHFDICES